MMQEENKRPDEDDILSAFEQVAAVQKAVKKKKMSSNTRLLIAVTAIVAVLAVALAVLLPLLAENNGGSSAVSNTSSPEEVIPIYDRSKDDTKEKIVQSIAFVGEADTYTIRYNKADKLYKIDGYEEFLLSASGMDELMKFAAALNGYDRVDEVKTLSDFGLNNPFTTVTVTYHDGTENTLLIGKTTPDEKGYYVSLKGTKDVYMLDAGTTSYFLLKKGQYLERTLIAAPTVKKDDKEGGAVLKELHLSGGPNDETIALRRANAADGVEYSYSTYITVKPFTRMVSQDVTEALKMFTNLVAGEGVVLRPTAADKKKYGFDKPYAQATVTLAVETVKTEEGNSSATNQASDNELIYYNAVTHNITVGSKNQDGHYYVMIDDVDVIYLVSAESMSMIIERTYDNTISDLMFLKNIAEVGKIQVTIDSKAHEVKFTHHQVADDEEDKDKELTVTYGNKTLKTAPMRQLYSQLMSLSRYGKADTKPTEKPAYGMKLYQNNGTMFLSLDFYATSSSLYTVQTNEGELFTSKASEVSDFFSAFDTYLKG